MKSNRLSKSLVRFCVCAVICCAASGCNKTICEVYNGGIKVDSSCVRPVHCGRMFSGSHYKDTGISCQ